MMHDCDHHRTNAHSFQGDPAQIFTSMDNDKIGPLWTRANLTPEGIDVCPRSEDLGRVVGERLLATSWGQRHFFFDLDEVDADFEARCLRLKEQLDP